MSRFFDLKFQPPLRLHLCATIIDSIDTHIAQTETFAFHAGVIFSCFLLLKSLDWIREQRKGSHAAKSDVPNGIPPSPDSTQSGIRQEFRSVLSSQSSFLFSGDLTQMLTHPHEYAIH